VAARTAELQELRVSVSRSGQELERLWMESEKLREYEGLADRSSAEMEKLNAIVHTKIN
jgi:hypothetical protein